MASDKAPDHALLYQINTRVLLSDLAAQLGRPTTLDDIPDAALDRVAGLGFKWVWMLGVWRLGEMGPAISRGRADWREEFRRILPDLVDADICGSCFAIAGYTVSPRLGGAAALGRLRRRLRARNLRLMLDFVPNHTALDHPWMRTHREYYIWGNEADLAREPHNYARPLGGGIVACGRDPYFPGWPDTAQLDFAHKPLQAAMRTELLNIASLCDGVRCDMAMLLLPEVFQRTWGKAIEPFWPQAIAEVRAQFPDFVLAAEVYWDLEWTLQQQGFDYTYDKRLYDRLRGQNVAGVLDHFKADRAFQRRLIRFLENHDEPRAAAAFPPSVHEAAAVLTYLAPGLRFFHQGQFEGRKIHVPVHLGRAPAEPVDPAVRAFYQKLLKVLQMPVLRAGEWRLLSCRPADDVDPSWQGFVGTAWQDGAGERLVVVVNYQPVPGRCLVALPPAAGADGDAAPLDVAQASASAFMSRPPAGRGAVVRAAATIVTAPAPRVAPAMTTEPRDLMAGPSAGAPLSVGGDGLQVALPPWGYRVLQLS
jgi:hypothetical protein